MHCLQAVHALTRRTLGATGACCSASHTAVCEAGMHCLQAVHALTRRTLGATGAVLGVYSTEYTHSRLHKATAAAVAYANEYPIVCTGRCSACANA